MPKLGELSYEQVKKNLRNEWEKAGLRVEVSQYNQSAKRKIIVLQHSVS
ncbi:hypothetical protein [Ammoniphilus sp. 3BR4]